MKITRMDLDMTGSPMGLVSKILAAEPDLPVPTPVEELARCFDIQDIAELGTEGFEGGLLTQPERTSGIILVNKYCSPERRRFTIGHELGHFLIPTHKPVQTGQFLCRRDDMRGWDLKQQDQYRRMEAEANQFAALLLLPPPSLRGLIKGFKDPSVDDINVIARYFQVSGEAAARSYVEYHAETLAVVFVKGSLIMRAYKGRDFPFLDVHAGHLVPKGSNFYSRTNAAPHECPPDTWFDRPGAAVYEQVQKKGDWSMILLWAELSEEVEEDEDKTSRDRYKDQQARYGR